ncbi:MAG: InlB B-repeat-containing protein [Bacteroidales bacterium]|nr:InlB B-repeat-containing protein [Bacteroidales bacterium]
MMNTLKKIGLTCLLVVIGWGTAAAATKTITISGMTGSRLTDDDAETSWTAQGAQSISFTNDVVNVSFGNGNNQDKAYVSGTVPDTWRITSISFTGGTPNDNLSYTLTVGGTQVATQNNALFTSVPNLIGPNIMLAISGGNNSRAFAFKTIQIEYTIVAAAPVLTYPDGTTGNNATPHHYEDAIPSSITIMADQVLYSGGVALTTTNASGMIEIVDSETNAISGAITLTTVTSNASATTLTLDIDKSKLTNCQTYTLMVVSLPTNRDGVAVASNNSIWYFSTPTITASDLFISGTKEFLAGSTFDHNDWVIKKGGVDITAQCTNFSNPNMTTAGAKEVTFDYAGCTITTTITITERATYTLTWKNLVTGEADITTQVQQGNTVGTLPKPATTTITTACGEKRFVGWTTTEIVGSQDEAPTLVQSSATPTANRILYAVYADATGGSGDTWEKINSAAQLTAGKTYLIGNTDGTAVMGSASSNNFKQVGATASGNAITPASGYNAVILGGSTGAWTLQLAGNNEYLYAASPTSNYLRSRADNSDDNGRWAIVIAANGDATVTAQGSNTRNMLRYNTLSELFSCYSGGQQSVSFYLNTGGGTGFITKCDCTPLGKPTGLSAKNASGASVDLSWTPVTGATSYLVEYSINSGSTWNSVECTGTPYKLTGLNKSTNYTWRIVALNNDGTYCVKSPASETSTFETTSNCAWQINYQPTSGAATWSEANCFSQVGNTNEWQLADFTLPNGNCEFWVGPGKFLGPGEGGHSNTVKFNGNLTFAGLQNTTCGKPYPGENAVGTLRIYSDSGADNYFVGFMPTYQIAYGLIGNTWEHLPFAYVSGNIYETALTEVPNGYWDNTNYQFYVGAKNADGGTNRIADKSNIAAMKTMGGLKDSDIGGAKGVYRIYDNSCDQNWYCAFIPYYNIVYYAADNTTVYQTSDYISSEKPEAERTINVLSNGPVKDGYRFIGWSHAADGAKQVDPGSSYKLWKCNDPLYPVYIQQVTLNYNTTGGVSVCEANTIDINTKTTVCADAPTRDGYKFTGWNTAQDGSGTPYAPGAEITLSESVTLYAQWLPYIKAYYDKTNIIFKGCDASDKQVVKGDVITLCGAPTSPFDYEFTSWAINGNGGYNPGATYTVSGAELEIKITPVWETPMHEFIFINQGAGTSQEVIISTVSGAEGAYITAPASCGTVPTNCEGKVFVGWLRGTYDGTLDGNEGVNTPEQLIEKAKEHNGGAGDVFFASPGQRIKVADQSAHEPANWDKWYAVFAIPE